MFFFNAKLQYNCGTTHTQYNLKSVTWLPFCSYHVTCMSWALTLLGELLIQLTTNKQLLIQHWGWLPGDFKRCGCGCLACSCPVRWLLASLLMLDRATGIPTAEDARPDLHVQGHSGGSSSSQQLSSSSLSSSNPHLPSFFFFLFVGKKKVLELESVYRTAGYRTGGGWGSQLPERHFGGRTLVSPAAAPS